MAGGKNREYFMTCENCMNSKRKCPVIVYWNTATLIHAWGVVSTATRLRKAKGIPLSGPLQKKRADPWLKRELNSFERGSALGRFRWGCPVGIQGASLTGNQSPTQLVAASCPLSEPPFPHLYNGHSHFLFNAALPGVSA